MGQIVHAHDDYALRAGQQLSGSGTPPAVPLHVVHVAVIAGREPGFQLCFRVLQVRVGDPELLKTQVGRPATHAFSQSGEVVFVQLCQAEYLL